MPEEGSTPDTSSHEWNEDLFEQTTSFKGHCYPAPKWHLERGHLWAISQSARRLHDVIARHCKWTTGYFARRYKAIADEAGLPIGAVSRCIDELEARCLVIRAGEYKPFAGRPLAMLRLVYSEEEAKRLERERPPIEARSRTARFLEARTRRYQTFVLARSARTSDARSARTSKARSARTSDTRTARSNPVLTSLRDIGLSKTTTTAQRVQGELSPGSPPAAAVFLAALPETLRGKVDRLSAARAIDATTLQAWWSYLDGREGVNDPTLALIAALEKGWEPPKAVRKAVQASKVLGPARIKAERLEAARAFVATLEDATFSQLLRQLLNEAAEGHGEILRAKQMTLAERRQFYALRMFNRFGERCPTPPNPTSSEAPPTAGSDSITSGHSAGRE